MPRKPINENVINRPLPDKIFKSKVGVLQYDLDGHFIKEYESMAAASKETGARYLSIVKCVRGDQDRVGNYIWKLKDEEIPIQIKPYKQKLRRARPVLQYDSSGCFIQEFESIEEALRTQEISRSILLKCLSDKTKIYKGCIWRYKENETPSTIDISNIDFNSKWGISIAKCDLQGNIIQIYKTVFEAAKANGVSRTYINNSLVGRGKCIDNCTWKYVQ